VQPASLRTFTAFLDSVAEDINRLWVLTGTVFSVQGPAGTCLSADSLAYSLSHTSVCSLDFVTGKETSGYASLLSATYDVSRNAIGGLSQAIGDAVDNAILPLLRIVAAKPTRTPGEGLQFSCTCAPIHYHRTYDCD
jgi:hypothetical protein